VVGEVGARLVAPDVDIAVGATMIVDVTEELTLRILIE